MKIKYVLIDIDGTLFPSLEFAKRARKAALEAMRKEGMHSDVSSAYKVLMNVVKEKGPNYAHHFEIMLGCLGEGHNARAVAAGVRAYHKVKESIRPFPDVRRALGAMRKKGLGLYIASEGKAVKQWDKILRMGLQREFVGAFISEELGVKKSPLFYRKICRKLKCKASKVAMIGDRQEKDVEPARKIGMRAYLIDRKGRQGFGSLLEVARQVE
ncbi:haloacid dehalogenase [Candidatus Micrarchaeota archaeon]|nr:MAG: haloacid dehalogenase [Candidatus Micrarchaeota archaeon]